MSYRFLPLTRAKHQARILGLKVERINPVDVNYSAWMVKDPDNSNSVYRLERPGPFSLMPTGIAYSGGPYKFVHRALGRYCKKVIDFTIDTSGS